MKTINPNVRIYTDLETAEKAFNRLPTASLLYSSSTKSWYVDKRNISDPESCFYNWPKLYTVIRNKKQPNQ